MQTSPFLACALEPGFDQKAILAKRGKGLGVYDLDSGRRTLLAVCTYTLDSRPLCELWSSLCRCTETPLCCGES